MSIHETGVQFLNPTDIIKAERPFSMPIILNSKNPAVIVEQTFIVGLREKDSGLLFAADGSVSVIQRRLLERGLNPSGRQVEPGIKIICFTVRNEPLEVYVGGVYRIDFIGGRSDFGSVVTISSPWPDMQIKGVKRGRDLKQVLREELSKPPIKSY